MKILFFVIISLFIQASLFMEAPAKPARSPAEKKFMMAAKHGDIKTVRGLFKKHGHAALAPSLFTALLMAARSNRLQVVKFLCKHTDFTADHWIAARMAVKAKADFQVVLELLKIPMPEPYLKTMFSHIAHALRTCIQNDLIDVFRYIAPYYTPPGKNEGHETDGATRGLKSLAYDAIRSEHYDVFLAAILDRNGPIAVHVPIDDIFKVCEELIGETHQSGKKRARNYLIKKALSIHDQVQPEDVSTSGYPKLMTIINFKRSLDLLPIISNDLKRMMLDNLVDELFPAPVVVPRSENKLKGRRRQNALPRQRAPKNASNSDVE